MLTSTYQRVGALAGVLLFAGSWLSSYYSHWIWPTLTLISAAVAVWLALDREVEEETSTRVIRGFVTGLIAAVVARLLGLLTMAWAFDNWTSNTTVDYTYVADFLKILFNGDFWTSVVVVLGVGVIGAFIGYAMPYFSADREEA